MGERAAATIVAITVESTQIATVRDHQMAIGTTRFQENVLVRVFTDGGVVGVGEAPHMVGHSQAGETPGTVRVVLRDKLIPAALGRNAFDHAALSAALDRAVPGNLRAKGALAMAAYDLAGKLLDTPVHDLLGGRFRDAIPLSWSLPIVAIDEVVREAESMVERGWRILKIKAGRPDPMDDVRAVAAVRAAVGDGIRLRADANQAYSVKDARRVIAGMAEHGLEFMEQPTATHDLAGLAEVTRTAAIPVMADETADTPQAVAAIGAARAADSVSIYVIGPGSLGRSKQMADIAGAFGLHGYIGGALESVIGASAGLHVAAACPAVDLGCEMTGQYLLERDIGTERLQLRDGDLVVPTGPGLGVELDEEVVEHYRVGEVERHGAAVEVA